MVARLTRLVFVTLNVLLGVSFVITTLTSAEAFFKLRLVNTQVGKNKIIKNNSGWWKKNLAAEASYKLLTLAILNVCSSSCVFTH